MRKSLVSVLGLTVMLSALGSLACAPAAEPAVRLVSLEDSLNPLKEAFNKAQDKPRILILLSPT